MEAINIVCTAVSFIGACKSYYFYSKSKMIRNYYNIRKAIDDINFVQQCINKMLEYDVNNIKKQKRGTNSRIMIRDLAVEVQKKIQKIKESLPSDLEKDFNDRINNENKFSLIKFIEKMTMEKYTNEEKNDQINQANRLLEDMRIKFKEEVEGTEKKMAL